MRIKNKYLRNRHVWNNIWKRVRNRNHPFETFHPYWFLGKIRNTAEEQIKENLEWITKQAREIDNGHSRVFFRNASAEYRRMLNRRTKAQERAALARIRNGDYETEIPQFKRDAAWTYW